MTTKTAQLIKKQRMKLNLTQKQLAKILQCHPQFISNIERGVAPLPIKKTLKLAKILKIDQKKIVSACIKDKTERMVG